MPALGASTDQEFYDGVYRRGVAAFDAGDYDTALAKLRIAAFGYVEDVSRFENAQAYIAAAARHLKSEEQTRTALSRILAAEKIAPQFASLQLPIAVRGEVEQAAKDLLPAAQFASLVPPPTPQISAAAPAEPPKTEVVVVPDPVVVKPAPSPAKPAPSHTPRTVPPPAPPQPATAAPPETTVPPPQPTLADADAAITAGDLARAREDLQSALRAPQLPHATLLKIGEALYRARDFRTAARVFERAGTFAQGEEPYRYYFAVALYETGQYAGAKRELAAALPYIEPTRDVARYQAMIEGAIEP